MPDWMSPAEIARDSLAFVKLQHALLGIYAWEWLLSLWFDWKILTEKGRYKWPLGFYLAGRYLLLFALIGIAIGLDAMSEVDCQALFTFNQLAGDAAVGLASINLSFRTIALWGSNRYIIAVLVLIILGHWSLILQGVLLKAHWESSIGACVIDSTDNTILAATFIYSMAFDLIVLLLSGYKLLHNTQIGTIRTSLTSTSELGKMIFTDGLIYFFIAFVANLLASTFMILNLNPIMNVIFNVPAAVASTIVASRVVRRLTMHAEKKDNNGQSSNQSRIQFRNPRGPTSSFGVTSLQARRQTKSHMDAFEGVHVQMDTFTAGDAVHKESSTENSIEYNASKPPQVAFVDSEDHSRDPDASDRNTDLEKGRL
ncbi:hypothetical protein HGRIS_011337 [Hohenbuehelia grisea]|uniref:Transmembrane protein n=1 Tax=Hohenbuehelia grisea TaxID=104357 RepID=A0ABR3JWQ7_9AGAR